MNIKDYLHLYLGCECDFYTDEEAIARGTLRSYDIEFDTADIGDTCMVDCGDIKPILRPLSSMTDEENKFYGNRKDFDALEFAYLLKQGYDLFGLIEAGLAIDKTKL